MATTFDALQQLATAGFFPHSVRKRAVILITDGESRPSTLSRSRARSPITASSSR